METDNDEELELNTFEDPVEKEQSCLWKLEISLSVN
jgi:hypothetical protein